MQCFQEGINPGSAGQGLNTVQDLFYYTQETLQVIEQLQSGHDLKIPRKKNKSASFKKESNTWGCNCYQMEFINKPNSV